MFPRRNINGINPSFTSRRRNWSFTTIITSVFIVLVLGVVCVLFAAFSITPPKEKVSVSRLTPFDGALPGDYLKKPDPNFEERIKIEAEKGLTAGCLTSMKGVVEDPLRHMVKPPDGPSVLTCCQTTKGPLSIAVHPTWAPNGAARFLDMVSSDYFSSKIAMFRCLKNFLCQFGLAGDPKLNNRYKTIPDDPSWLPLGRDHRQNEKGIKRFQKGYFAFAGGGQNSRSNQLIVALKANGPLCGGSPWEVPWGELVGDASFQTLDKIYTGYGENGPNQGRLHREGSSAAIAEEFPLLDYVLSCQIVEDGRHTR